MCQAQLGEIFSKEVSFFATSVSVNSYILFFSNIFSDNVCIAVEKKQTITRKSDPTLNYSSILTMSMEFDKNFSN